MSDLIGDSSTSQVIDITQETHQPVYAIYEKGTLSRVALINYLDDPSGNSDYTAVLSVGGNGQPNGTPAQVKVK